MLLSELGATDREVGRFLRATCYAFANWQPTHPLILAKPWLRLHGSRVDNAHRFVSTNTSVRWLRKTCASNKRHRYVLFAHPKTKQDIQTIAKAILNIMTQPFYLPTTLISSKGSALVSQRVETVPHVLGITLEHTTTKHAEMIGMLDKMHVSCIEVIKNETGHRRSLWLKSVNMPLPI